MDLHAASGRRREAICGVALVTLIAVTAARPAQQPDQQTLPQLGGKYADLEARRQRLVADWVTRFNAVTHQTLEPGLFYDNYIKLSTKTTFDAITFALERTSMTDRSGQPLGDALDLLQRVETTKGQVIGASGDRQFRMYVVLKEGALDTLARSREFRRGADNSVFHKGYPINYRQSGTPSIQVSGALDGRRADIDVDYRASSFPAGLFNGHLTAANSDVRAGNNYDRHTSKWAGYQNWWRSLFGIRVGGAAPSADDRTPQIFPSTPRAGDKNIDVMVDDFLKAWLVDGDMAAAMSYVSERAYACLAEDGDDPFSFDRGTAPFALMNNLEAAHQALGPRTSLEGLTVGVRLSTPALRVVNQPHHARFVIYSVPDDVAAAFDCESRLTVGDPKKVRREYGKYFGATFYVDAPSGKDHSVALLWGRVGGYWKIVSWKTEPAGDDTAEEDTSPAVKVTRIKADASLVQAAKDFLDSWLIRKDYDAAFRYFSPKSYPCYDLTRRPDAPASTSLADAGQRTRAGLERVGATLGPRATLDEVLEGVEPRHPSIRVMDHPYSRVFALASFPTAFAAAVDCSAPERRERYQDDAPPVYANEFGMSIRFRTRSGETPVLRALWVKEADGWRITVYGIEMP